MKHRTASGPTRRWLDSQSDASFELRELMARASSGPNDSERIAALRDRLAPWLGNAAAAVGSLSATTRAPSTSPPSAPALAGQGLAQPAAAAASGRVVAVLPKLLMLGVLAGGGIGASVAWLRSHARESTPASVLASNIPVTVSSSAAQTATPIAKPTPTASAVSAPPRERSWSGSTRPVHSAAVSQLDHGVVSSSLEEEARLLRAARDALGQSATRSLELLHEHARRFPKSTLGEERSLFTIRALLATGRVESARAELERLRGVSPGSPHVANAERLIAATAR